MNKVKDLNKHAEKILKEKVDPIVDHFNARIKYEQAQNDIPLFEERIQKYQDKIVHYLTELNTLKLKLKDATDSLTELRKVPYVDPIDFEGEDNSEILGEDAASLKEQNNKADELERSLYGTSKD